MNWDDGLTGVALNIAATDLSPLRVMAGPGTGKSFAMKRRMARLLETGQDARRILAVTFTRNAAGSLVRDLHALGVADCDKVRVGTLHGFCFSTLSRQVVFGYLGRVPRPVITFSKSGVLRFEGGAMLDDVIALGAFGPKRDCTKRIRAFEAAWARLQSEVPGWPHSQVDRQFQAALTDWLRFHRAMLIGELVPETLRFLRSNPACDVLTAFDHVIVDEYQDLNKAEQELLELLRGRGAMAIVGDVDQSIYRFRHANPEGIEVFHMGHPTTHDETLDECRRCPTRVVAIADHLIRHNHPSSTTSRLQPKVGNPDGEIHIVQWTSVDAEAQHLAEFVNTLVRSRGVSPQEILILTPRRLLGYKIRDRLKDAAVPVHSFYHEEALEEEEAQRAFALLMLLVDDEDRVALRWWLGDGSPSRRRNAYQRLRQHCEVTRVSPKAALDALDQGHLDLAGVEELLVKYRELRDAIAGLVDLSLAQLIDELLPEATETCSALREAAILAVTESDDLAALLDRIKRDITQPEMPQEGDFVRAMSLHKSKGLTSRVAIVVGCTQGLIPFQKNDETAVEQAAILLEQRRLFYVAITRCTEILVLSSVIRMERTFAWKIGTQLVRGRGPIGRTIASQFIAELGPMVPPSRRGEEWVEAGYV